MPNLNRRGCCTLAVALSAYLHASSAIAEKMYYSMSGNGGVREIQRANLDGTGVETLVVRGEYLQTANDVELDLVGGNLYWTDVELGTVTRAKLDGSNPQVLFSAPTAQPTGLALDPAANKMYWIDNTRNGNNPGFIRRANLDGSGFETLLSVGANLRDIELDLVHGKMYWTNERSDRVQRANLDGTNVEDLYLGTVFDDNFEGITLDVQGNKMYWTDVYADSIRRANLDGSNVEVIARADAIGITIDVLARKLYWADIDNRSIVRANLDGSNQVDVLKINQALYIALDVPVPEPSTFALLVSAVVGAFVVSRRRT